LEKLLQALQTPPTLDRAEPASLSKFASWLHQQLAQAGSFGLSNSTYVRPHLVRKLLILFLQTEEAVDSTVRQSWEAFLGLQMPDEGGFLKELPASLQNVAALENYFQCPPLLLSCFACLAKPLLKKRPSLLSDLSPELVEKELSEYFAVFGFNPSLERLFSWRSAGSSRSSQVAVSDESSEENL
jgi:hypothetical protein